jgi:hypothetical protein
MRIRRVIALMVLVALGLVGLNNATSWPAAQSVAQRVAAAVAVGAGVLALACAAALWRGTALLRGLLLGLVAATAAAAGLAPWAWGGAPARAWLTAAIAGAALGGVAVWLAWPPRAT